MKKIAIVISLLLVFIFAFILFKTFSQKTGTISVNSFPQKASVYLNGELKGETPLVIKSLPYGTYEVKVVLEGYREYKEEVKIDSSNPNALVTPILEHAVFSVNIESDPPNALVYIDGILRGKTPVLVTDLTANENHLLVVKLESYKDWKQTITGKENDMLNISAKLEPVTTELIINSIPSNATVYLNGIESGKTPLDITDIQEGTYNIKVSFPQYVSYQETIEIKKGNLIKREVVLPKAKYYISISSNPPNAKVFIDNIEVGVTPYEDTSISEGKHKIHLELEGYLPYETEITVTQNQPTIISINLLKLP